MTAGQFALAMLPVCAALAGLVLWIVSRGERLEDGALVRRFLVALSACALLAFGVGRSDTVQLRLNPEVRVQRAMEVWPVQHALEAALLPDEARKLKAAFAERAVAGEPAERTQRRLWSYLQRLGTERMGFAGQAARVSWAREMRTSFELLRAEDPDACYAAMSQQPVPDEVLPRLTDDAHWKSFQAAFVEVIDSGARESERRFKPEPHVDFNDMQAEYQTIRAPLLEAYGAAIMTALEQKPLPAEPAVGGDVLCAARIAQLDAALERPTPMASHLVDGILR